MKTFVTLLVLLGVLLAGAAVFIWSGAYNVAATDPHAEPVRWTFVKIRDHSIAEHSEQIEPPPLTAAALVQTGFRHYHAMCVMCHGAPGRDRAEIAEGLNPAPPDLDAPEIQNHYSDAELYWIVKHGIKMTGMPAFGPTHAEEDLWALVAFLRELPQVKPKEYEAMVQEAGLQDSADGHAHQHGAAHKQQPVAEAAQGGQPAREHGSHEHGATEAAAKHSH